MVKRSLLALGACAVLAGVLVGTSAAGTVRYAGPRIIFAQEPAPAPMPEGLAPAPEGLAPAPEGLAPAPYEPVPGPFHGDPYGPAIGCQPCGDCGIHHGCDVCGFGKRHKRHKKGCGPKVVQPMTFTHPYTCCPVTVEVCVPTCAGCPEVDWGKREIEYEWDCCDYEVEIKFKRNGSVKVDYDD